jgi:hypothetical protein
VRQLHLVTTLGIVSDSIIGFETELGRGLFCFCFFERMLDFE